jgi:hypothetical protein
MRSARPRLFFLSLFLGGMFFVSRGYALEEKTGTEQSRSDLSDIKTRLAALEKKQDDIIAKEDKILEELAIVKIWVHRK